MEETLKLSIDSSGAEKGAAAFEGAIKRIKDAITSADAAATSLGKIQKTVGPGFTQIAKTLNDLGAIKISSTLGKNVDALAMALRKIDKLDSTKIANIARAINTISIASTGVSARGATQTERMAAAIAKFQLPANHAQIVQFLRQISAAGNALQGVRLPGFNVQQGGGRRGGGGGGSGTGGGNNGNGAGGPNWARQQSSSILRLKGDWRGLENAMNVTYQTGTVLRGLFTSLTLAAFTQKIMDATSAFISFNAQMEAVAGQLPKISSPTEFAAAQYAYVADAANKMGISLQTAMKEFPKLATAMMFSGRSADEAQSVFNAFGSAMRVMGLSADRQQLVMLALTQGFSKGRVSAEELRRQLGEQIPGAFELMQQAIREFTGDEMFNLDKALREGKVSSDAYILLADKMAIIYAGALPKALQSSSAQFTILGNEATKAFQKIGTSGVDAALADSFRRIAQALQSPEMQGAIDKLSQGLIILAEKFGDLAVWAVQNIDGIAKAIKYAFLGSTMIGAVQAVLNLATSFRTLNVAAAIWMPLIGGLAVATGLYLEHIEKVERAQTLYKDAIAESGPQAAAFEKVIRSLVDANDEETSSIYRKIDALVKEREMKMLDAGGAVTREQMKYDSGRAKAFGLGDPKFKGTFFGDMFSLAPKMYNAGRDLAGAKKPLEDAQAAFGVRKDQYETAKSAADSAKIAKELSLVPPELKNYVTSLQELGGLNYKQVAEISAELNALKKSSPADYARLVKGTSTLGKTLNPLVAPETDKTAKQLEREREKRINEAESAIKRSSPIGEMAVKRDDVRNALGSEEGKSLLKKYGLDGAKVMENYNQQLKIESGLLDEVTKATLQQALALANLKVGRETNIIDAKEYAAREAELTDAYERQMGLVSPLEAELRDLEKAKRAIIAATDDEAKKQEALNRLLDETAKKYDVQTSAQKFKEMQDNNDALDKVAKATGGNSTNAKKNSARSFADNVDPTGDIEAQIQMLKRLQDQALLTADEVFDATMKMKSGFYLLQAQGAEGTWIDQFKGRMFEFFDGFRGISQTVGDLFAGTLTQGVSQLGDAFADVLMGAKSLQEALYEIASGALKQIISGLVQWAVKALLIKIIGDDTAKTEKDSVAGIAIKTAANLGSIALVTAAQVASGAAIAAAMAPAAYFASLATGGANAAAASVAVGAFSAAFGAAGVVNKVTSAASSGLISAATGGIVTGPGTGTSDSIPERLSNGEFVVNASATRDNLALLNAINSGEGIAMPTMSGGGGGAVIQNNIEINVSGGNEDSGNQIARQLIPQLEAMTKRVLANEMRPGGMLRAG